MQTFVTDALGQSREFVKRATYYRFHKFSSWLLSDISDMSSAKAAKKEEWAYSIAHLSSIFFSNLTTPYSLLKQKVAISNYLLIWLRLNVAVLLHTQSFGLQRNPFPLNPGVVFSSKFPTFVHFLYFFFLISFRQTKANRGK